MSYRKGGQPLDRIVSAALASQRGSQEQVAKLARRVAATEATSLNLLGTPTQLLVGSGTFAPTGRLIIVELWAAGGGGGGAAAAAAGASAFGRGAAAGGYSMVILSPVEDEYAYVVGAKGTGGPAGNNSGNVGNDSSFGAVAYATGGGAGGGGSSGTGLGAFPGAGGGNGTIGDLLLHGDDGVWGGRFAATNGISGGGGGAPRAGGQVGGNLSTGAGPNGSSPGGGGCGGASFNGGAAAAGGDGADGLILVWQYGS